MYILLQKETYMQKPKENAKLHYIRSSRIPHQIFVTHYTTIGLKTSGDDIGGAFSLSCWYFGDFSTGHGFRGGDWYVSFGPCVRAAFMFSIGYMFRPLSRSSSSSMLA